MQKSCQPDMAVSHVASYILLLLYKTKHLHHRRTGPSSHSRPQHCGRSGAAEAAEAADAAAVQQESGQRCCSGGTIGSKQKERK
jgi:hypothetical protein